MSASRASHSDVVVGIDFGTTKICVAVGKRTSAGIEVIGFGREPSLGIRKGVVVNIPQTVEAIRRAVKTAETMSGVEISRAYVGIAGSHIKGFNTTGIVAIKDREIHQQDVDRAVDAAKAMAIPMDREVIHVIPQEFRINDEEGVKDPLGMAGVRLEAKVHIVTGAVSSAQNIIKCANQAGIQVIDIVLEPLASAEAALMPDERELGVALVDIGGGTTDVALFSRGSVIHTGVIPMGGNHITNDIAVGIRCSIQDAEKIKIASGSAMSSLFATDEPIEVEALGGQKKREISRSVLAKIIEPRVEEILSLVGREISSSGCRHILSTGMVITGGSSMLQGVTELAEFLLEMPVRRGVPQGVIANSEIMASPSYSTAIGLLLYGVRHQMENRFRVRDSETSYFKVVSKMRAWLGEVF